MTSSLAPGVGALELADYQRALRLVLRHPLITANHPDRHALPAVRRWSTQLSADLAECFGYTLTVRGETARLRRIQDALDPSRPALARSGRPFDRRRYGYLALTLAALGRSGTQIALSELAEAVAADAGRIEGLGMDTGRKPDRDAFVDAVTWLEERDVLRMADGSAAEWVDDPEHAEALYDIGREELAALWQPARVLQHLGSVAELLGSATTAPWLTQGREATRRAAASTARRLVLEQPVVYYSDVDASLRGQLRSPSLAEDLERLTGLTVERRAEGVALVDIARRLSDTAFPSGGTVAQAALLLCARIAERTRTEKMRGRIRQLPAATAAERLAEAAARLDEALPERPGVARLLAVDPADPDVEDPTEPTDATDEGGEPDQDPQGYPFLAEAWLRQALDAMIEDFGSGMSAKQTEDPDRLLRAALGLLDAMGLVARVDGGILILPLLARYRSVTAHVKSPAL